MAGGVMGLLFLVVGVAVIGGAALLLAGRWRDGLPEIPADASPPTGVPVDVPVGSLTAAEIEEVRLEQALRGYRMEDVDVLVDRLTLEIQARDAEIDRLRGGRTDEGPEAP
jgi:DivIVA domain-containing protein